MNLDNTYANLFILLIRKLKILAIVGVVAIVFSVVFSSSYFISPKFEAEAVLYPSNLIKYSDESPSEQMLQMFQGNDVRDNIIEKFNLSSHYKLDKSANNYLYSIHKEYRGNITVKKTSFESVVIKVLDTDPKMARDITLELINQLNIKIKKLHKQKSEEILVIRKSQIDNKKQLIGVLENQIKHYSLKYGLLDYVQQSREVTAGYMNMLLENKKGESMQKVENLYNNIKTEGRHFHDLHHQFNLAREEYGSLLIRYDEAIINVNKNLTYTNVIVEPEIADKKSYPIRWLIVVLSFFTSIFFTIVILLFTDRLKANN